MGSINPPKNSFVLNQVNSKTIATVRELYKGKVRALPHDVTLLQDEVDFETWQKPSDKILQSLTVLAGTPTDPPKEAAPPTRQEAWLQRNQQQQEHHSLQNYTNQAYSQQLANQYNQQQFGQQPFGQQQFGQQQFGQQQFGQQQFNHQQFNQQQFGQQQQFAQQPQGTQQYLENTWANMQKHLGNAWNSLQGSANDYQADSRGRSRSAHVGGNSMDYQAWPQYNMSNDMYVKAKNRPKTETKRMASVSPVRHRGPSILQKQLVFNGAGAVTTDGLVVTEIGGKRRPNGFEQRNVLDRSSSPPPIAQPSMPTFYPQLPAVSPQNSWTYRRSILDKVKHDATEKKPEQASEITTEKKPEQASEITTEKKSDDLSTNTEKKPEESSTTIKDKKPDEASENPMKKSIEESNKTTDRPQSPRTAWRETLAPILNMLSPKQDTPRPDTDKLVVSDSKAGDVLKATPDVEKNKDDKLVSPVNAPAKPMSPKAPPRTPHIPLSNIITTTVSPKTIEPNTDGKVKLPSPTPEKLNPPSNRLEVKSTQSEKEFNHNHVTAGVINPKQTESSENNLMDVAEKMKAMLQSAYESFNYYFDPEPNIKIQGVENVEKKKKSMTSGKTGTTEKDQKPDLSLPFMENKKDSKEGLVRTVESTGQTQAGDKSTLTSPKKLKDELDSLAPLNTECPDDISPLPAPKFEIVKQSANGNGNNKAIENTHNELFIEDEVEIEKEIDKQFEMEDVEIGGPVIETSNTPKFSSFLERANETSKTPKRTSIKRQMDATKVPRVKAFKPNEVFSFQRGLPVETVENMDSGKENRRKVENTSRIYSPARNEVREYVTDEIKHLISPNSFRVSSSDSPQGPAKKPMRSKSMDKRFTHLAAKGMKKPTAVNHRVQNSASMRIEQSNSVNRQELPLRVRYSTYLKPSMPYAPLVFAVKSKEEEAAKDESEGGKYRCSKLFVNV